MQPETAAVEALPAAFCAEHLDVPSQGTCPRCGRFVCGRCLTPPSDVCRDCQRRLLDALPSAEPRARWASWAMRARASVALGSVVLTVCMLARLEEGRPTLEDAEVFDGISLALVFPMLLSMVVSALLFLRWLHLMVRTANTLGVSQESTAWAMGCWFIPLVNLFKPYALVRDLRKTLGGAAGEGLLQAWWAVWVLSNVGNRLSTSLSQRVENDASMFAPSLVADLLVESLILAGAVLCIRVMREVQSLLNSRVAEFAEAPKEGRPSAEG